MFKKKNSNGVTEDAVMKALSTVIEPELHRDLVSLNMIRDLKIDGNDVSFTIMLTTPACPLKGKMEADSRAALAQIDGLGSVQINWDANVPTDARINNQLGQSFRNTIAVSSGKGGVGGLVGAGPPAHDGGPNVPMMLGVEQMPPPQNRKMVPAENFGVKFISMAFLVKPDQPLIWRGPMLHSAIRQLLSDVDWGELDYLIVDLPPGTGDAQLTLAQVLPLSGAIVVTQPMQVAAADALRGLKTFEKLEVPIIGVVENMSGEVFGTGAGEKLAADYETEYLGSVPMDANIRVGGDSGQPILASHPDSEAAAALREVSRRVAARVSVLTLQNASDFIPIEMVG